MFDESDAWPCLVCNPRFAVAGAAAAVGDSNNYTDSENAPLKPVAVSGNHAFSNIAAGVEHACAIDLKGSLWCWGSPPGNGFQQGTLTPMEIKVSAEAGEEDAPSPPSPLQPYVALSVGDRHTCAIDSAHAAWCFGELGGGLLSCCLSTRCMQQVLGAATDAGHMQQLRRDNSLTSHSNPQHPL